jgi:hypothetical protein
MPSRVRTVPFVTTTAPIAEVAGTPGATTTPPLEQLYPPFGNHHDGYEEDAYVGAATSTHGYEVADIIIPGSFVVLQGSDGDGLSNTINSLPPLRRRNQGHTGGTNGGGNGNGNSINGIAGQQRIASSFSSVDDEEEDSAAAVVVVERPFTPKAAPTAARGRYGLPTGGGMTGATAPVPGLKLALGEADMGHEAIMRGVYAAAAASTDDYVVVTDDNTHYNGDEGTLARRGSGRKDAGGNKATTNTNNSTLLSTADEASLKEWSAQCRRTERRQRKDWKESLHQVPSQLLDHCMMVALDEGDMWWQSEGRVAILRNVPTRLRNGNVLRVVIGTLNPGATVVATSIVVLDSDSLQLVPTKGADHAATSSASMTSSSRVYPRGQKGLIQMVQVETAEGRTGFAVLSLDGYPLLAPGLPSHYVDPTHWIWRVTCPAGAYVREGLDLSTRHIETLPYGSLVRVTRRTINNQGLSRLRTHGTVDLPATHCSGNTLSPTTVKRRINGWCSELLNPLSGQRGIVAQPLPFPVPALYKVTLSMG